VQGARIIRSSGIVCSRGLTMTRAWVMAVLGVACVLSPGVRASVPAPRLWVNAGRSLFKVSPRLAEPLLEIRGLRAVRALAVDRERDRLWVCGDRHLWAFDRDGAESVKIRLTGRFRREGPVSLVIDTRQQAVWLGSGRHLDRFDFAGRLVQADRLARPLVAMTLDPVRARLWLDEGDRLVVLDAHGEKVQTIVLGPGMGHAEALAYDAALDEVWVAGGRTLSRYEASNRVRVFTTRLSGDFDDMLAPDGAGDLWAAGERRLAYITGSGDIAQEIHPLPGDLRIRALTSDPLDQRVWVADRREVLEYAPDGERRARIRVSDLFGSGQSCSGSGGGHGTAPSHADHGNAGYSRTMPSRIASGRTASGRDGGEDCGGRREIRHLVFYANPLLPSVAIVSPRPGGYTNNSRVPLVLSFAAAGSAIDPATIVVRDNGATVAEDCVANGSDTGATCTPLDPLSDGVQEIQVTVTDRAGRVSVPATVVFTVETVPPVITLRSPTGTDLDRRHVTLTGQVSQAGTLTVNGISLPLDGALGFADPVTLADGANRFVFEATDRAGNVGTLTVTLDYAGPPEAPDAGLITVGDPVDGMATVTGQQGFVIHDTKSLM